MKEVAWCDSLQMNSVKKREAQNTRVKDAGPGDKHGEDWEKQNHRGGDARKRAREEVGRGGGACRRSQCEGVLGTHGPEGFESNENLKGLGQE